MTDWRVARDADPMLFVPREARAVSADVRMPRPVDATARHAAPSGSSEPATASYPVFSRSDERRAWSRGWPLLANDMFRLIHRDRDGVSLLDPHVTGLGLSAALLGELLLAGHLTVQQGLVVITDVSAPSDVLAHTVLDQVASEHDRHPVRTWLAYLGRNAYAEMAARMQRAGHIRTQASRRLLTRTVRYVPTDMNAAAWPWARLARAVSRGELLGDFDILLSGLAVATDLHRVALVGDATPFAAAIRPVVADAAPPIRELITHTKAAAGDAVITKT